MNNFDLSLQYVLKDEGGNSDDPRDPGGRTSRGITQREYDAWCRLNNKSTGDVWNATDDEVRTIYHDQYWLPYCDNLPTGLNYLFFDISVNAGRTRAVKTFQQALGNVEVDGMFGQVTKDGINSADPTQLIATVSEQRRQFYHQCKEFNIYGKGWLNRVNHSEIAAKAMVANQPHDKPAAPSPKATDANTPSVSPEATATATGGLLTILAGFKDQIQNLSDSIPNLKFVLLGIAVIGLGYAMYGMYRNKQIGQVF